MMQEAAEIRLSLFLGVIQQIKVAKQWKGVPREHTCC
jgi:hypothetical protein